MVRHWDRFSVNLECGEGASLDETRPIHVDCLADCGAGIGASKSHGFRAEEIQHVIADVVVSSIPQLKDGSVMLGMDPEERSRFVRLALIHVAIPAALMGIFHSVITQDPKIVELSSTAEGLTGLGIVAWPFLVLTMRDKKLPRLEASLLALLYLGIAGIASVTSSWILSFF